MRERVASRFGLRAPLSRIDPNEIVDSWISKASDVFRPFRRVGSAIVSSRGSSIVIGESRFQKSRDGLMGADRVVKSTLHWRP